jgi:hypothetical protein
MQRNPDATRPFQKVHTDFFEVAGSHYLVITDEFLGCPMLYSVGQDTTASMVVRCLQQWFIQWGVPTVLRSDNGPQFAAAMTQAFLCQWGVTFELSSPRLPHTNGRAEAAVKAMKRLIRGATHFGATRPDEDEVAAGLLAFRNTSRYGGKSPVELAFGRATREGLPTHWQSLEDPRWAADPDSLDEVAEHRRERLAAHYDAMAKPLDPFPLGTPVAVMQEDAQGKTSWPIRAVVIEVRPKHQYVLRQENGRLMERNRVQLRRRYPEGTTSGECEPTQAPRPPPAPAGLPPPAAAAPTPPTPPTPTPQPPLRKAGRAKKKNKYFVGDQWTT